MTYILLAIILVLCSVLALVLKVVFRLVDRDQRDRYTSEPSNLSVIVTDMLMTIEKRAQWDSTERMRDDLRHALWLINKMRHDQGQHDLRASKPARSIAA
jgi:hypothetical protein